MKHALFAIVVVASLVAFDSARLRAEPPSNVPTSAPARVSPVEPPANPMADPAAVVTVGKARFTVLTPAMIRMEWAADGAFEDRASFAFINRRMPVPAIKTDREGDWTVIRTAEVTMRYRADGDRFDQDNLSIELKCAGKPVTWRPGTPDTGNLRGTTRTLDGVSGACDLEPGILSRDGWAVVDDSQRLLFDGGDPAWVATRAAGDRLDWYFFGYGHDYQRALLDFTRVAGKIPLPPRWVFGAWWSRYWAYSDAELRQLVQEFNDHDVPLDVLVVDMDWHLDGWTGYTWNPKYFPDPPDFLKWAHEQGLKVTLNLHPADGVGKHEAAFGDMCRDLGLDPAKAERVPFDCTDRKYMAAYFKRLHHPLERMGVDFWWLDWQQGTETKVAGLDPLFWLNHLHWEDMARNPERVMSTSGVGAAATTTQPSLASARGSSTTSTGVDDTIAARLRPLIFSRWGGLGNHRYPIGFSGDTYCNWQSLAFQPYFTATAGNVGYAYWSHDIGGHQPGKVDPELYVRWIQWGALSPVLRTHTTKNPDAERRIWEFPEPYFLAAREAYKLRYQLLPYIYTMARKTYDTGLPLCRPLYYEWPELDEAYARKGEYLFGDDLLVAPVTEPSDPTSGCANVEVWIPPGKWTNWFTGKVYTGPTIARLLVPLDDIPLFVRDGAMIPMTAGTLRCAAATPAMFAYNIFPGRSGQSQLYFDDGATRRYLDADYAWLPASFEFDGVKRTVKTVPPEGRFSAFPPMICPVIKNWEVTTSIKPMRINGAPLPRDYRNPTLDEIGFSNYIYFDENLGPNFVPWYLPSAMENEILLENEPLDQYRIEFPPGFRGLERAVLRISQRSTLKETQFPEPSIDIQIALSYWMGAGATGPGWPKQMVDDWFKSIADPNVALGVIRDDYTLIHWMGLYHRLAASRAADLRYRVDFTLAPTYPLLRFDHFKGTLRFGSQPEVQWTTPIDSAFDGIADDSVVTAEAYFDAEGPVRTIRTTVAVQLRMETVSHELKFEKTLFPSINHWQLLGPFDATFDKGLTTVFPVEANLDKIDLSATYDGKGGKKIGWRPVSRRIKPSDDLTAEYFVDLNAIYDSPPDAVAYGLTYLHAPEDVDASLAFGTDDGAALWLNGKEIYRQDVGRAYTSKLERVPVRLKKGVNPLLIKVKQGTGGWGFCVHVETPDGKPLPNVTARLDATP